MSELRDLYQQLIIDHGRRPRNFGSLATATHTQEGYNPLCGDKLTLYLQIEGNDICDLKFKGEGCAISLASASLMTEILHNKSLTQAEILFQQFHHLVTHGEEQPCSQVDLGKLVVLAGVAQFPARVKCASLAWHTLNAVLQGNQKIVSTE